MESNEAESVESNPAKKKRVEANTNTAKSFHCGLTNIPKDFKLPNRFRPDIQVLLEDKESVMTIKNVSAVLREIANSVQIYTYTPTQKEYNFVARKAIEKYPHLSVNPDFEGKVVSIRFYFASHFQNVSVIFIILIHV